MSELFSSSTTFVYNPFGALAEVGFTKAWDGQRGELFMVKDLESEYCPTPCLLFNNFLFRIPKSWDTTFFHVESKLDEDERLFIIPSASHPLVLVWSCLIEQMCEQEKGYVYVLRCKEYYKIGIATDLKSRLGQYRTENPFPTPLVYANEVYGFRQIEKKIHEYFDQKNHRGEWFRLSVHDLNVIRRCLSSYNLGDGAERAESLWKSDPLNCPVQHRSRSRSF